MDAYCRLCAERGNPMINIFDEKFHPHKLTEKLDNRLHLTVSRNDTLSKNMCLECYGRVCRFEKFFLEVRKSQNKLNKLFYRPTSRELNDAKLDDGAVETNEGDNHVPVITYPRLQIVNDYHQITPNEIIAPQGIFDTNDETNQEIVNSVGEMNYMETNNSLCEADSNIENSYRQDANNFINIQEDMRGKSSESPLRMRNTGPQVEATVNRGDIELRSRKRSRRNPKFHLFRRTSENYSSTNNCNKANEKRKQLEVPERMPERRKSSQMHEEVVKKNVDSQVGNTLHADLKGLKNSLLIRKLETKNASVLTIPIPNYSNPKSAKSLPDTSRDKGCQTEILLAVKAESRVIYQKLLFEGRTLLEIGSENNAVITSPLCV